jgi:hypothetical protein
VYEDFWIRWDEKRAAGSPLHRWEPKVGSVRWVLVADSDKAAQAIARHASRRYQGRVEGRALAWTKANDDVDAAITRGQLVVGRRRRSAAHLNSFWIRQVRCIATS